MSCFESNHCCGCQLFQSNDNKLDEDESASSFRSSDIGFQSNSNHRYRAKKVGFFALISSSLCGSWIPSGRLSMSKAERSMKAAILIQQWYRRYLARMEVRRRYTWTIFQSIEYSNEQDQLKLYSFFNALLTHIPDNANKNFDSETSRSSSSGKITASVIIVDSLDFKFEDETNLFECDYLSCDTQSYNEIHINFPLKRSDLDTLIEAFRKKKHQTLLHAKYVAEILKEAITKLRKLPNLNQASTAISKQVTVCGDIHGKLDDLLVIFHKNGLPSPENPYVFNGDFVDRGKKGLEVLLILLVCLIVFPGSVFLNRGNHEDHIMNIRYGFIREMNQKYKKNADKLLKLIEKVYKWLPLGTIVNNKVFIVHGGISDSTDLDLIKSLDRGKYVSLLRPPINESCAPGAEIIDKIEWKQVFDLLWSDPQNTNGCIPNALRGAGTYYGPDITSDFLNQHKFLYLIRSHECKPEGYEVIHGNKLITIFSASNYYEIGSNKGAYLKLVGSQLSTHFVQFTSAGSKSRKLTFHQKVGLIEKSAIRELFHQIMTKKEFLEIEFHKYDVENSGLITVGEWSKCMEKVTYLSIPWRMLRDKLVATDPVTNKVQYMSTFNEKFSAKENEEREENLSVLETLYTNKYSLEAVFRIIDKDNSGYISLEEFSEICDLIQTHMSEPITKEQLIDICKLMDINKDGLVDLNEFLETFRLVQKHFENKH